jgi:hypothetical protein
MSDAQEPNADKMPETDELQEPSTEKDPGEEPKDPEVEPEEVDHRAEGIGVIGSSDGEEESTGQGDAAAQTPAATRSESAPPTEAASDEVKRDAAFEDSSGMSE